MYTKTIPFKDFHGKPRNQIIHLNLSEREVMGLLYEFQSIFSWQDQIKNRAIQDLNTQEVVEFYNNLETILLSAYGVPSEDGLHFDKDGRYKFEQSALFNAVMMMFVKEPEEATKMINELMPKDLEDLVSSADERIEKISASKETPSHVRDELEQMRKELAEMRAAKSED